MAMSFLRVAVGILESLRLPLLAFKKALSAFERRPVFGRLPTLDDLVDFLRRVRRLRRVLFLEPFLVRFLRDDLREVRLLFVDFFIERFEYIAFLLFDMRVHFFTPDRMIEARAAVERFLEPSRLLMYLRFGADILVSEATLPTRPEERVVRFVRRTVRLLRLTVPYLEGIF
tara:strand:- start:514 stop:1029 length:516 start_codon:yes stop_codon:yes gene_type:complete